MFDLARRLIHHQPLRYLVALLGVSAAAGLAFIQLGLYFGFKESASVVPDHTEGHIWVCDRRTENFDFPKVVNEIRLSQVRELPGVKWAQPLIIVFGHWKLAPEKGGGTESVQIIGFNPASGIGKPWNMVAGFPEDLSRPGCVSVDTTTAHKLGSADLNSKTEISGITAKVAALTGDIRSFQGHPMVFTSIENARSFGHLGSNEIHYIIIGLEDGVRKQDVIAKLNDEKKFPYLAAFSSPVFSKRAQDYWLNRTSAGTILALSALMGIVVGIVVAGQVLYTATLEHLREYGTMKAIGATNFQVGGTVVSQAVIGALPAHALAGGLLWAAQKAIHGKGIHIGVDLHTYLILGIFTIVICVAASFLSVYRVLQVDPADVFKSA